RARTGLPETRRRGRTRVARRGPRRLERAVARSGGARRCVECAGGLRRAEEPGRRDALLWGAHGRRDGGSAARVTGHGDARLAAGQGMVTARTEPAGPLMLDRWDTIERLYHNGIRLAKDGSYRFRFTLR